MGLRSITPRRLNRAIVARLSRFSLLALNSIQSALSLRCNACGRDTSGFFSFEGRPFGCPYCRSSSRERLILAALDSGKLEAPPVAGRILHVAPSERAIIRRFASGHEYVAVDLLPGRYAGVDIRALDLTQLHARHSEFGAFDLIYASHVMEHIPDDRAAYRAVYASLRPGGQAWFLVPLSPDPTEEGTPGLSVFERERRFGQWDHVRQYGPDISERISQAGFAVSTISAADLDVLQVSQLGLDPADKIFVCKRLK